MTTKPEELQNVGRSRLHCAEACTENDGDHFDVFYWVV
jgi:hypothetical protein